MLVDLTSGIVAGDCSLVQTTTGVDMVKTDQSVLIHFQGMSLANGDISIVDIVFW